MILLARVAHHVERQLERLLLGEVIPHPGRHVRIDTRRRPDQRVRHTATPPCAGPTADPTSRSARCRRTTTPTRPRPTRALAPRLAQPAVVLSGAAQPHHLRRHRIQRAQPRHRGHEVVEQRVDRIGVVVPLDRAAVARPAHPQRPEPRPHPRHEVGDEDRDDRAKRVVAQGRKQLRTLVRRRSPDTSTANCSANAATTASRSDVPSTRSTSDGNGGSDSALPHVSRISVSSRVIARRQRDQPGQS